MYWDSEGGAEKGRGLGWLNSGRPQWNFNRSSICYTLDSWIRFWDGRTDCFLSWKRAWRPLTCFPDTPNTRL